MSKSKFSTEQIRHVVHRLDTGTPILTLCCENQISSATIYGWRRRARQWEAEKAQASSAGDFVPPSAAEVAAPAPKARTPKPKPAAPSATA